MIIYTLLLLRLIKIIKIILFLISFKIQKFENENNRIIFFSYNRIIFFSFFSYKTNNLLKSYNFISLLEYKNVEKNNNYNLQCIICVYRLQTEKRKK